MTGLFPEAAERATGAAAAPPSRRVFLVDGTALAYRSYFAFIRNPLVNSRGELVGINTMIYSETGGYQGIGFAIPSNMARRVMELLIRDGEIVRGSIGNLSYRVVSAELARAVGLPEARGARIIQMYRPDPAYRAGLLPDDVIVRFNGELVRDPGHLQNLIAEAPIGSTARIEALRPSRGGDALTVEVQIARLRPARRRY